MIAPRDTGAFAGHTHSSDHLWLLAFAFAFAFAFTFAFTICVVGSLRSSSHCSAAIEMDEALKSPVCQRIKTIHFNVFLVPRQDMFHVLSGFSTLFKLAPCERGLALGSRFKSQSPDMSIIQNLFDFARENISVSKREMPPSEIKPTTLRSIGNLLFPVIVDASIVHFDGAFISICQVPSQFSIWMESM
jgi:hypothetical protein